MKTNATVVVAYLEPGVAIYVLKVGRLTAADSPENGIDFFLIVGRAARD